jgi:hypothetical protein
MTNNYLVRYFYQDIQNYDSKGVKNERNFLDFFIIKNNKNK